MHMRTSWSPPRRCHDLSSALWRTFFKNNLRLLSWAFSRPWRKGFGFGLRDAYLNLVDWAPLRIGED